MTVEQDLAKAKLALTEIWLGMDAQSECPMSDTQHGCPQESDNIHFESARQLCRQLGIIMIYN